VNSIVRLKQSATLLIAPISLEPVFGVVKKEGTGKHVLTDTHVNTNFMWFLM